IAGVYIETGKQIKQLENELQQTNAQLQSFNTQLVESAQSIRDQPVEVELLTKALQQLSEAGELDSDYGKFIQQNLDEITAAADNAALAVKSTSDNLSDYPLLITETTQKIK